MEKKIISTNEKLAKELKTLVSRMKNENAALSKILAQFVTKEDGIADEKPGENKCIEK